MITAVVSSMVFFIVPSRFVQKNRVFIQASLPFKSFIGFTYHFQTPCAGLKYFL